MNVKNKTYNTIYSFSIVTASC